MHQQKHEHIHVSLYFSTSRLQALNIFRFNLLPTKFQVEMEFTPTFSQRSWKENLIAPSPRKLSSGNKFDSNLLPPNTPAFSQVMFREQCVPLQSSLRKNPDPNNFYSNLSSKRFGVLKIMYIKPTFFYCIPLLRSSCMFCFIIKFLEVINGIHQASDYTTKNMQEHFPLKKANSKGCKGWTP